MQISHKPYHLLLLTSLLLVTASFFASTQMVDIHLHDTYFVLTVKFIYWLLAALALFAWVIYLLSNKRLYSKSLTWAHTIISMLTIAVLLLMLYSGINNTPRQYYDFSAGNALNVVNKNTEVPAIILVMLLAAQITFILNFLLGMFRRKT